MQSFFIYKFFYQLFPEQRQLVVDKSANNSNSCVCDNVLLFASKNNSAIKVRLDEFILNPPYI